VIDLPLMKLSAACRGGSSNSQVAVAHSKVKLFLLALNLPDR
jgi:hypothetical protein